LSTNAGPAGSGAAFDSAFDVPTFWGNLMDMAEAARPKKVGRPEREVTLH